MYGCRGGEFCGNVDIAGVLRESHCGRMRRSSGGARGVSGLSSAATGYPAARVCLCGAATPKIHTARGRATTAAHTAPGQDRRCLPGLSSAAPTSPGCSVQRRAGAMGRASPGRAAK